MVFVPKVSPPRTFLNCAPKNITTGSFLSAGPHSPVVAIQVPSVVAIITSPPVF